MMDMFHTFFDAIFKLDMQSSEHVTLSSYTITGEMLKRMVYFQVK